MVLEEGLEARFERHARNAASLRAGLEAMGLQLFADAGSRLNQITTFYVPNGIDEAELRKTLLSEYNLEIGGGLGPVAGKILRIGLMSASSQPGNVFACLSALEDVLLRQGYELPAGAGVAAAQRSLAS
jgi:alanine-glyoxylate transaminase/serine-glyoxylate transaminase/serine-pyruvate transaminase